MIQLTVTKIAIPMFMFIYRVVREIHVHCRTIFEN